jgi:hypothetical protein
MIQFTAVTVRRFKDKHSFSEFVEYLKDHVPLEVHADLRTKGIATRVDTEENGSEVCSKWMVQEVDDE